MDRKTIIDIWVKEEGGTLLQVKVIDVPSGDEYQVLGAQLPLTSYFLIDPAASIDRKCECDGELLFVAENDATVVGTVMAGYDRHRGWAYSLAVAPPLHRQGNRDGTRPVR